MILLLLLSLSIFIFGFSIYTIIKASSTNNVNKFQIKDKKSKQHTVEKINENLTIIYATINEQINDINQKLLQIYDKISAKTQTEIITEIDTLKNKLQQLDTNITILKSEETNKKTQLCRELTTIWNVFSNIKQLLEIDYESLTKQRDYLKRELQRQEIEYSNLTKNYNDEITKLNNLIADLKTKYSQDILHKLQLEVIEKTKILENIDHNYVNLKTKLTEKVKFLDEMLSKKSSEIEGWFNDIKQTNEKEILELKSSVESMKPQVEQLNIELKNTILSIKKEQVEKKELINQLNKELQIIKSRQFEIESLRSRKDFLANEVLRLEKEYSQLQMEYKELTTKKAAEIQNLRNQCEINFANLSDSWSAKEKFYKEEIQRLTRKNLILSQRKQRLLKIEKQKKENYSSEQRILEEKLFKAKTEFEKQKLGLETNIRSSLNKLEFSEKEFKKKIEQLKTDIKHRLQDYNDKIVELKKRSEIREQRIKRSLFESMKKNDANMQELIFQIEQKNVEVKKQLNETKSFVLSEETKLLSNKERLEFYNHSLDEIIKNFEITKNDIMSLEIEISKIENNVYEKFDDILRNISFKKQFLAEKLSKLLSMQEKLIIKQPEIKTRQKG